MGHQETPPDVVLRAKRGARAPVFGYNRRPIVATVDLTPLNHGAYDHPEVKICTTYGDGSTANAVCIRYQRHRKSVDSSLDGHWDASRASGFMGPHRTWSRAYGAEMRLDLDRRDFALTVAKLIDRAFAAMRGSRPIADDLLCLLVGLRRIGVEVRIWNADIRMARANRPARPARALRAKRAKRADKGACDVAA